ncbi:hypothetical protein GBA63_04405 [Rubrobacter tropicus]|uniref:Uncharacterized protein n=1 Tax=Rubrobacter tropicus TaxID=2653851 RepID=A0A6G8Q6B1_9ACTN|nr:hypothetical protein [Rubrobacter tropicus]QIN81969.1 hypothetical protein GBA63_04405 [Rubrobacter tropicus]
MIHVTFERRYGTATVRSRVTAPSIERAAELAGEGARLVFPVDPGAFFQPEDIPEGVERLADPGRTELAGTPA